MSKNWWIFKGCGRPIHARNKRIWVGFMVIYDWSKSWSKLCSYWSTWKIHDQVLFDDSLYMWHILNLAFWSRILEFSRGQNRGLSLQEEEKSAKQEREKTRKKEEQENLPWILLKKPYQPYVSSRFLCAKLKEDERGREEEGETREISKETELVSEFCMYSSMIGMVS